jgi:hypothetical protein
VTRYLRVRWDHDPSDDPIVLYHELDDQQRETRRVELFEDGRLQWADQAGPDAPTSVSLEPLPALEEIRDQPEFSVSEISRPAFEEVWARARGQTVPTEEPG